MSPSRSDDLPDRAGQNGPRHRRRHRRRDDQPGIPPETPGNPDTPLRHRRPRERPEGRTRVHPVPPGNSSADAAGSGWNSANTDQYGRTIGLIYQRKNQPKDSYNLRMVQGGHARPYMTGAQDRARFQAAEESARSKKRGIWKQKTGWTPGNTGRPRRPGQRGRAGPGRYFSLCSSLQESWPTCSTGPPPDQPSP